MITLDNAAPGDSVTTPVLVTSGGLLALRYALTSSATITDGLGLAGALTLTIKTLDSTAPGMPCDNFNGTLLYSGDLAGGVGGKLVGDSAQGEQQGDRALTAGANETLCFRVSLASTATGSQNASTAVTFTFDAEQTNANP